MSSYCPALFIFALSTILFLFLFALALLTAVVAHFL
jgi:hypothetical protein